MGISQNQYDYLTNLSQGSDGNAAWAKSQLEGATVDKPAPTPTSGYTTTAPNYTKDTTPSYTVNTPSASSYTGSANQIGNVSGSTDLAKSYQDLYNSTRNSTNQNSQLNTWGDSKGNVYDTTSMSPQQIFALSLAKDNNPNAAAILKGMGLDMNGNSTSPAPTFSNANSQSSSSGSSTASATYKQPMQTGTMTPLSDNPADYAQGGKYYQAPTYNLNSAEFQNKTDEEKKAIFQSNPSLAAQEIERAKQVWASKAGDPEAQQLAHQWANKVGLWAGLRDENGNDIPTGTGGGTQNPTDTGTTKSSVKDPNAIDPSDPNSIVKYVFDLMQKTQGAGMNPNDPYWSQQKANSDLEQQGIFNSKISQYQNLLNSLKTGQGNDLKAITDGVDSATNKIEDNSFQKWLEARQNAASRGLAGSGIASDANTRLLLSRQHDLADMFTQKNTAMNDVNKRYSDQINTAQSGIANTNLNAMQAAAFQKLFKDGQDNLTTQGKSFADLFGVLSKQNMKNQSDEVKYALEKYKTDANTKYLYDKMDSTTQQETAKLQLEWEKYGLDITKTFGQDPKTGKLTLDAAKLLEQVQHNRTTENISQAHNQAMDSVAQMNASTNAQNANSRADEVKNINENRLATFKLDVDKFKDSHLKGQADTLYQSAQAAQKEMDSIVKQKADYMSSNYGSNVDQNKLAAYDAQIQEASNKIEDSRNAMLRVKDMNNIDANSGTNTNPNFQ